MNNLSIVNIIDDENVFLINQLAEILGKGPNNIGIKLQNDKGEIYWGCHSWWTIEQYIMFKDFNLLTNLGVDISLYKKPMMALYESIVNTQNMTGEEMINIPLINWEKALSDKELTIVTDV